VCVHEREHSISAWQTIRLPKIWKQRFDDQKSIKYLRKGLLKWCKWRASYKIIWINGSCNKMSAPGSIRLQQKIWKLHFTPTFQSSQGVMMNSPEDVAFAKEAGVNLLLGTSFFFSFSKMAPQKQSLGWPHPPRSKKKKEGKP